MEVLSPDTWVPPDKWADIQPWTPWFPPELTRDEMNRLIEEEIRLAKRFKTMWDNSSEGRHEEFVRRTGKEASRATVWRRKSRRSR